jgi:hypothetical protein
MARNIMCLLVGSNYQVIQSCFVMMYIYLEGIVPTIEDFSGSNGVPSTNGTRLGFSGGNVTVNVEPIQGEHTRVSPPQGFSRNYSMWQQGLTADVSCRAIGLSQTEYGWNMNSSFLYGNAAAPNGSITGLRLWNVTANCGDSEFRPHISCLKFTISS